MSHNPNLVIEYTGSVLGKSCSICKMELKKGGEIVQCPHCLALFHLDHLAEWLQQKPECPSCQSTLYLEEKSVPKIEGERLYAASIDNIAGHTNNQQDKGNSLPTKSFSNPTYLPEYGFMFKKMMLIGAPILITVFAVIMEILAVFLAPIFGVKILAGVLVMPFILIGGNVIYSTIKRTRNLLHWKEIIFRPEKITIVSEEAEETILERKGANIEIPPQEITQIKLGKKEESTTHSIYYLIELKIACIMNREYILYSLYRTNSIYDANTKIIELKNFIRRYYKTDPQELDESFSIKKILKPSLLIASIYLIFTISLIVISELV